MDKVNFTTLNEIKKFTPCESGWNKLLNGLGKAKADDDPLFYSEILEINGISDAIWSLRTNRKLAQDYAIACAEAVLPIFEDRYKDDGRPRECIFAAKAYLAGEISINELREKRRDSDADAYAAAAAYAAYAAYAAAGAAAADDDDSDAYAADADQQEFKKKIFLSIVKNEG